MNMQAMLKQAQKLQSDMMKSQEEIYGMSFTGKASNVSITINGKGEVTNVEFNFDEIEKDDLEMLQDMTMVAFNDAKKQLDKVTEEKMGAYTKGLPGGLF